MKSFLSHVINESLDAALPPDVRGAIIDKGAKIYQIGGVVRDEMLGKASKDLDLLVVGLELNDLSKILEPFGKVNLVGKSFGILKFTPEGTTEEIDISIPRIDEKSTGKGHKDFEIKLGRGITLQQDQLRRDFWMNAIAKDVETGEVHDIGGKGKIDIDNKIVRMINPQAFQDDPLRMLRAVQFASRFKFKIEPDTYSEIKKNVKLLKTVSAERFSEEFKKLFEKSTSPSIGIKLMVELGIMKLLFPQVKNIDYKLLDRIEKSYFPAFMGVLLKDYKDISGKIAQKTMKLSNEEADGTLCVTRMIWKNYSLRDPVKLVKFTMTAPAYCIDIVDGYLMAAKKETISNMLNSLRRQGKPTSLRELPIGGRDLMDLGFRGKSIGDTLGKALELSIKGGLSREELLKWAKSVK